ncbi:MAG TPA: cytochrome d ubiquinol oxidase subunit II [Verrucomicrobiae bacterium]|nr:cytochrome d ubiquinol oxidase subunit II [Verrucomicrobiae bacterium]
MVTIWFCLIAVMIAVYVVLDGFDLGAGIIHLGVARTDSERRAVLGAIGPVWDGNEVWLLAAGGTLFFAYPVLYASSFSGFYLPLMMVLWLLILRGISIEFRSHLESPIWSPFWDAIFSGSSALLAIFFGAALGNVVRGVPLDASGYFFEPLWTNFKLGPSPGILDWYTVLVGLAAYFALTQHGALWVAYKTTGALRERARHVASGAWFGVVAFTILITWATFRVQPHVPASFAVRPWGIVFPILAVAGLIGVRWFLRRNDADQMTFFASCAYLLGMLTSVVFGVYPYVLPACTNPAFSLTIYNAKAPNYGLRIGLIWWFIGMALVVSYFTFLYRHVSGKVGADTETTA